MSTPAPTARLPYVLLGAMTFVSFAGPFLLVSALQGGSSGKWPPDRPVEWAIAIVIFGLVIGLFVACVSIGWWHRRASSASNSEPADYRS